MADAATTDLPAVTPPRPAPARDLAAEELPDSALFWRWVWKAVRQYIGWILVGIGVFALLLGYLGVSRQALVAKQLPYLISGGVFGIILVIVGTFYLATEELRRDSGRLDRLERMVQELHLVLLSRADAPDVPGLADLSPYAPPAADTASGNGGSAGNGRTRPLGASRSGGGPVEPDRLLALPDGQRYHRPDCPMVEGKAQASEISVATARRRRLQPCGMCEPVSVAEDAAR